MSDLALTSAGRLQNLQGDAIAQLQAVAGQFEGQFMQILMEQARDALPGDDGGESLFGESSALDQFTEMLHAALIEQSSGQLGIADIIVDQFKGAGSGTSGAS